MKSTIRVDFAGQDNSNGFEPVIRVNLQDSEDVRDGLLKTFFQSLGEDSNWLSVNFQSDKIDEINQPQRITIYPVKSNELEKTMSILNRRIHGEGFVPEYFSRFHHDDEVDFTTSKAKKYAFDTARKLPENKGKSPDEIEYLPEYFYGKIVAVKFTKAKIYYDILGDYSGKVFEGIPSEDIKKLAPEFSKGPKQE